MSKILLIETNTIKISPSQLTENVNKESGNLLVEGILATAEVKNGNGRYYSKDLWNREMDKYSELIEQRRSMGELDHPESTVINLKNVSHLITDYFWDGDNVMGKIEILPTPSGNILKGASYLAHHLYWLVAPLGLTFLISKIFSIVTHFSLPDIDYLPLFAICIISIILFQLANSPDENENKSNKIIEKIVVYYNNLLPLIPVTYLYKIFTNFSEQNGDLMCNAAILETCINWGNFTPLLAAISLLYLTVVQAYYTNQDKSVMQQDLAKASWWWCAIFTIICLIAYNPYFSIEEDNNHYNLNCHHFKKHTLTTLQSRNLA